MNQSTAIETISFHGDQLHALKDDDGKIMVGVKPICDALGLNHSRQLKKLKEAKWARVVQMTMPDQRGHFQEMAMVDHESIPYWLATIKPGKVSPMVAEKLEKYQAEVKEVLARHFLSKPVEPGLPDYDPNDRDSVILANMLKQRTETLALQRAQEAQWQEIKRTETLALQANDKADQATEKVSECLANIYGRTDHVAIVGYCNRLKINITEDQSKRVGIAVSNYCRKNDINYGKASIGEGAENHKWDQVNCYPRSVLDMWRNGEIKVKDLRIENNKIIDDAVPKPKLFTHHRNYWY